jgi:hypothetical protein
MKITRYLLAPLVFLSFTAFLTPALAQMTCSMGHMDDPLGHLPMCVTHHYNRGDIDNNGIYQSLLSKAQNAVTLADQGNIEAATKILNSFINELQAQSGKHITESNANMLINHAGMAINQISS